MTPTQADSDNLDNSVVRLIPEIEEALLSGTCGPHVQRIDQTPEEDFSPIMRLERRLRHWLVYTRFLAIVVASIGAVLWLLTSLLFGYSLTGLFYSMVVSAALVLLAVMYLRVKEH